MLLLPLRSDLGDVTRALGCLIAEGEIGQGPRRFDLMEDLHFPVIPGRQAAGTQLLRGRFRGNPRPLETAESAKPRRNLRRRNRP